MDGGCVVMKQLISVISGFSKMNHGFYQTSIYVNKAEREILSK